MRPGVTPLRHLAEPRSILTEEVAHATQGGTGAGPGKELPLENIAEKFSSFQGDTRAYRYTIGKPPAP